MPDPNANVEDEDEDPVEVIDNSGGNNDDGVITFGDVEDTTKDED